MNQIYLFKDGDIHVGNSSIKRDSWDSLLAAGWEHKELNCRAISSPRKRRVIALSYKDVLLLLRRGGNKPDCDLRKATRLRDSFEGAQAF